MPIPVNDVLNRPIYSSDMTRYVRSVRMVDGNPVVTACSPSDWPEGGDSDRDYTVDMKTGQVGKELLTHKQAFDLMYETLKRVGAQFINNDGMTGGRCVELATETLERIGQAVKKDTARAED